MVSDRPKRLALLTALIILPLLISRAPAQVEATAGFEDGFDGRALGQPWAWDSPGGAALYAVSEGNLNIVVGGGSDQWVDVDAAPRVLKAQPPAPYGIETQVVWTDQNGATFAGLAVFRDPANWLVGGWHGGGRLELSGIVNGLPTPALGVSTTKYAFLRLRKATANPVNPYFSFYFDASPDGLNWTNVNVYHDWTRAFEAAETRVGFLAKDWNAYRGPSYSIAFGFYREYPGDPMPSALSDYLQAPPTAKIGVMTGPNSPTGQVSVNANVCGTDLGIPFIWRSATYFAFGDTRGCAGRPNDRSSALAFSPNTTTAAGLSLQAWLADHNAEARDVLRETTGSNAIPTGAIGIGNNAYIFFMEVSGWEWPGAWRCSLTSVASASAANPAEWTNHQAAVGWGPGGFSQLAVLHEPSTATLYLYGTPCGRSGSVRLMKVPEGEILNLGAYSYLAGFNGPNQPVWSPSQRDAITVAGGPAGELSVRHNAWLGSYVMTYLDQAKEAIVLRESPTPWGPWSAPIVIARNAEYPKLYGAFMQQGLEDNGGETIYFTMSQWDPYNVFLMRTTLLRRPR